MKTTTILLCYWSFITFILTTVCHAQSPRLSEASDQVTRGGNIPIRCDVVERDLAMYDRQISALLAVPTLEGIDTPLNEYKALTVKCVQGKCSGTEKYLKRYEKFDSLVRSLKSERHCNYLLNKIEAYEAKNQAYLANGDTTKIQLGGIRSTLKKLEEVDCNQDYSHYVAQEKKWVEVIEEYKFNQSKEELYEDALFENDVLVAVQSLLEKGLNPKVDTWTLEKAIYTNNIDLVKLIVEHGAPVNFEKGTALDLVVEEGSENQKNYEMIKYLESAGAKIEKSNGEKLAKFAISHNDVALFKAVEKYNSFTWKKYSFYYYKTKEKGTYDAEIGAYIGGILKTKEVEHNWGDYRTVMDDEALEKQMITMFNEKDQNFTVKDIKIVNGEWLIEKNETTGATKGKFLVTYLFVTDKYDVCGIKRVHFFKPYDGTQYGPMQINYVGKGYKLVNCSSLN